MCFSADFWVFELDPLGRKLLVHLQGDSVSQGSRPASHHGGRRGPGALAGSLRGPQHSGPCTYSRKALCLTLVLMLTRRNGNKMKTVVLTSTKSDQLELTN